MTHEEIKALAIDLFKDGLTEDDIIVDRRADQYGLTGSEYVTLCDELSNLWDEYAAIELRFQQEAEYDQRFAD